MKKAVALTITLLILIGTIHAQNHVPRQLLIQFNNQHPEMIQSLSETFDNLAIKIERRLSKRLNIWLITIGNNKYSEQQAIGLISADPRVKYAQLNHYVEERDTYPNDPAFSNQWHLENTGQSGGTPDADIDAVEAWDQGTGGVTALGDTIVLAIIDSGNYLDHEDLDFWKNEAEIPDNDIDDDGNGYVDDYDGWNAIYHNGEITNSSHGTHVSGIAGAIGNNGIGVSGINWGAKIMPIRGSSSNESVVVEAYAYVLEMRTLWNETEGNNGAFVVATNASFGVNFGNPDDYPIWCAMYDSLGIQGVLSVGATMNSNANVDQTGDMPTACDSDYLISVTNTTNTDIKYSSAAYGLTTIDLGAPGTNVYSTDINNGYSYKTGTSMAAPQVTGAIGYIMSLAPAGMMLDYQNNPGEIALEFKDIILQGVDPIVDLEGITVTGGRLNIYNSIQLFNENDDFIVSGPITEDTIWDTALVRVVGDVTVEENATLTITPGTVVEFQGYYSLTVEGNMIASGDEHNMVYFTINDVTGFSNNETTEGAWKGIKFTGTSADSSLIRWSNFSYTKSDFENPNISKSAVEIQERDNLRIELCNFTFHIHDSGSAISCHNDANPIIKSNHFEGCLANQNGGAIYLDDSSPSIVDNSFIDNTAEDGSAIFCLDGDPDITDNYFDSNVCIPDFYTQGGAIYLANSSSLLANNIVMNNNALQGGAIYGTNCNSQIMNNHFENNSNPLGQVSAGGAIYLWEGSCLIKNNSFINNSSARHGGALHMELSFAESEPHYVINNIFSNNESGNVGGAICCYVETKAIIFGNLINNNTAAKGGGVYSNSALLKELSNNTFYMNDATNTASALLISQQGDISNQQNNIFWNNTITEDITPIALNECTIDFRNNLLENGITSITQLYAVDLNYENNLEVNPQFSDIPEEFLMLTQQSPCINSGLGDMSELFLAELDLAGNPRIYEGFDPVIDMGAYEYQGDIVESGDNDIEIPEKTAICTVYPNPFSSGQGNRSSDLKFTLFCAEKCEMLILDIFNIKGQKIKSLYINNPNQGTSYTLNWDGKDDGGNSIGSGIYFSRLTTNRVSDFRKFIKLN